jgi:hypothetical protein
MKTEKSELYAAYARGYKLCTAIAPTTQARSLQYQDLVKKHLTYNTNSHVNPTELGTFCSLACEDCSGGVSSHSAFTMAKACHMWHQLGEENPTVRRVQCSDKRHLELIE